MSRDKTQALEQLAQIKYVGPALAKAIYDTLSVVTVDDLIVAAQNGKLQTLSGVGVATEAKILQSALDYRNSRPNHAWPSKPNPLPITQDAFQLLKTRFIETLRCPACGHDKLEVRNSALVCQSCQRQFGFQNGIADLAPPAGKSRGMAQRLMELQFYAQFYEDIMRPRLTGVVTNRTLREEYQLASDYLELSASSDIRLLDVACGTGNFTRYFAQRLELVDAPQKLQTKQEKLPLIVGMDISWPMLEAARKYLKREGLEDELFLVRGDATRIPVKRAAFNRLHCGGALHLMNDIDDALRNFARVLEPGGLCVIGTFVLGEGLLKRYVKRLAEIPTKFHWFSQEELYRRLERSGFYIEERSQEGDALTIKARRP